MGKRSRSSGNIRSSKLGTSPTSSQGIKISRPRRNSNQEGSSGIAGHTMPDLNTTIAVGANQANNVNNNAANNGNVSVSAKGMQNAANAGAEKIYSIDYNITDVAYIDRKNREIPMSQPGPVHASADEVVSQLLVDLKELRRKPPFPKERQPAPTGNDDNENELMELADAFIQVVEEFKTSDFAPPSPTLTFGSAEITEMNPNLKAETKTPLFKPQISDILTSSSLNKGDEINTNNNLEMMSSSNDSKKVKPSLNLIEQRRLSGQLSAEALDFDHAEVFDDQLSQALYELSSVCKNGFKESPEATMGSIGSYEASRRLLFSIAEVDVSISIAQSNFMKKNSGLPIAGSGAIHAMPSPKRDSRKGSVEFSTEPEQGSEKWQPPRIQVYFQIPQKLPNGVELQKYCCYNCGSYIDNGFIRGARYCEYTGKFHCRSCHSNQTSIIPARVLFNWDFKQYKVSDRSKEFLEGIWNEPIFDVSVINKSLYEKQRPLLEMKVLRTQLSFVRDFLYTCNRSAAVVQKHFSSNAHILNSIDMYSMQDFVGIQNGTLVSVVKLATSELIFHVTDECPVCKSRGFICEFCNSNDVLYPFQLKTVYQCPTCKSFFHKKCYVASECPKCMRIEGQRLRAVSKFVTKQNS